jgi:hypothetical protein
VILTRYFPEFFHGEKRTCPSEEQLTYFFPVQFAKEERRKKLFDLLPEVFWRKEAARRKVLLEFF